MHFICILLIILLVENLKKKKRKGKPPIIKTKRVVKDCVTSSKKSRPKRVVELFIINIYIYILIHFFTNIALISAFVKILVIK